MRSMSDIQAPRCNARKLPFDTAQSDGQRERRSDARRAHRQRSQESDPQRRSQTLRGGLNGSGGYADKYGAESG